MKLTDSNAGEVGTSNVTAIASATAEFRQFMCYAKTTISQAITGATGLIKNGTGELNLSGVCNYTGTTQINSGTLSLTSVSTSILNGVISGTGVFSKTGTGTLTLGGNNTYSGGTILGGIIIVSNNNSFGTGTVTGSGSWDLRNSGTLSVPNNFTSASQMTFRISGFTTVTILGTISGIANLVKLGNGALSLSADLLAYTSTTSIGGGFLIVTKSVGSSTATATFQSGGLSLVVSFNVAPPSGVTTFRFFQGTTTQTYAIVTLVGLPVGSTATYNSSNSTLTVTVP
jgi:autotransporter-associated beta strand protein